MNQQSLADRLQQSHVRLWLAACRAAFAAALLVAVFSAWLAGSSNAAPLKITPERINPNSAPLASLVRLPGIGRARALDIIAYRNSADEPAFESAASLEAVKGIGPKTSESLSEWVTFDDNKKAGL